MPLHSPASPLEDTAPLRATADARPLIDVIIPCFNYGAYVGAAVDSILGQTLPHVGVIVVDGGSDDGHSPAIVRSLERPRVRVFCREGRHYVGDNRNFGIAQSRAKYVCCLDADDTLDATYLEKALFLMETYGYDLVSTSLQFTGAVKDMTGWNIPPHPSLEVLLVENQITTCAVYRREMWESVGGYRDYGVGAEHVSEDWELWIRFAALGARMRNISAECLLNYRLHAKASLSTMPENMSLQAQLQKMLARNKDFLEAAARKRAAMRPKVVKPSLDNELVRAAVNPAPNPNNLMIVVPFMTVGGTERLLSNLTGYLVKQGWSVTVVATNPQEKACGDTYGWFRKHTDSVYALPLFLEPQEWKDFLSYLIEARKPHCILNVGSRLFYEMTPDVKKKYPNLPLVDLFFNTIGHTKSHMEFRKFFDSAIAETEEVYDWLKQAGWGEKHIKKIVSGVDLQRFRPREANKELTEKYNIANDEIVIGFFGRLAEEKAPDVFVEIARYCAGNGRLRFVMAGAGNLAGDIEKQIKTLPTDARLDFMGRVDDVEAFYSICDMMVLSSRCDGRPMAVMEALASGLPVIASRVGGVPEMVEDGLNGYLCKPGNIAEFAGRIGMLAQDGALLRQLKNGARAYAERHFDADLSFARYHDALYPAEKTGALPLPESLPLRLVVLEQQGYTGGHARLPDALEGKLFWNLFLKDSYCGDVLPFTEPEREMLVEPAIFHGYPVPRYISLVDKIMSPLFYEKVCNGSLFKKAGLEYFLIDLIIYTLPLVTGKNFDPRPEWLEWFLQPAAIAGRPEFDGLPKCAATAWLNTPDLQAKFDLATHEGRYGLLGWLCRWRLPSLEGLYHTAWLAELDRPSSHIAGAAQSGLSGFMEAAYYVNPEAKASFDLATYEGRLGYVGYFCRWFLPVFRGYRHPGWLKNFLDAPASTIPHAEEDGITHFMEAFWVSMSKSMDIYKPIGRWELLNWFMQVIPTIDRDYIVPEWVAKIAKEKNIALPQRPPETPQPVTPPVNIQNADTQKPIEPPVFASRKLMSGGANLIGWPQTEIGIGEDIRVAASAFQSAQIPFAVIDAARRLPPLPAPVELGLEPFMSDAPRYDTDVVFLDTSTQYRYYAFDALRNRPIDRKTIGVCPWELPLWPREVAFSLETLDIFWAATRYIRDAFAPYFPAGKIMLAPPAVVVPVHEIEGVVPLDRNGPFYFLTIFDGLSSIHRKNPMATVQAFQAAFPGENRDVRLIVKMMNLPVSDPVLQKLMRHIGSDDRIEIVNKTLTRSDLFALVRRAHCFVSLHRSEGFGRNIAESMALGRPVICSAYSGNLDFCDSGNSYLVEGREADIRPEEYTFSKGQTWFDPSVDHAAMQMREVYGNWPRAVEVAAAGQKFILDFHSLEKTGARYADLLKRS